MGQRQSSQRQDANNTSTNDNINNNHNSDDDTNENTTRRGRVFRPSARLNVDRNNPISRTTNENQRRNERRTRRARIREEQYNGVPQQQQTEESENEESSIATLMSTVTEAIEAAAAIATNSRQRHTETTANTSDTPTTTTANATEGITDPINSPFSRMIAQVISEAVVASFRNGQIPSAVPNNPQASNVRQQLTMHLSPELFRQLEPESTEDTFMRFMRLPVVVTSVSTMPNDGSGGSSNLPINTTTSGDSSSSNSNNSTTTTTTTTTAPSTAVNADGEAPTLTEGESEVTRIMMLPVFLYGLRSVNPIVNVNVNNQSTTSASNANENTSRQGTRSSSRIRERQQRQQQQQESGIPSSTPAGGQWTVYIISGNSVENIMNDNPSYEELLDLAALIGPARLPTVSQEAIDNNVPIVKYTQQVKQTILGNSEGCQVCLNSYQSEDDVRVLACHHGFHKDCIDKWLTEGQNQCPLCRGVPIPTNTTPPTTND